MLMPVVASAQAATIVGAPVANVIHAGTPLQLETREELTTERKALKVAAAGITDGLVLRRVNVRRYKARAAVRGRRIDSISGRETWDLGQTLPKAAVPHGLSMTWGRGRCIPGRSAGPIYGSMIQRAFDSGALPDLTMDDLARLLKGISAHSTRVGLNQDLSQAARTSRTSLPTR